MVFNNAENFDIDRIKDDVPIRRISERCAVVSVAYVTNRMNQNRLENKVLHLKILSCTMGGVNLQRNTNVQSPMMAYRKQKLGTPVKAYNRFFLCADLANPPNCAAIVTKSTHDSAHLLKYTNGKRFIGVDFYLFEPDLTFQSIGGNLPVLSFPSKPLFPLKDDNELDQCSELTLPTQVGSTSYFVLEGVEIHLHRVHVSSDTSCGGLQCDRQKGKGECTCVYNGSAMSALVYGFDVEFPIPEDVGNGGMSTYCCHKFRSFKTTKVFFQDFVKHCSSSSVDKEEIAMSERRESISEVVDVVNDNGGWKVVGWSKLGEVNDAANENEKVENNEVNIHLSYLYPKNSDVFEMEQYKDAVIKNDGDTT